MFYLIIIFIMNTYTAIHKRLKTYMYHVLSLSSMPITSVRRSWPMQIVKGSLYVMIELLKLTDVS